MTNQKMIFFDIDGTLITQDERHVFPESAKNAIIKARENGHLIFINTGRVKANLDDIVKAIPVDGYVCGCGTAVYYNNEELLHNTLSKELCKEVALLCRDCDVFALFESDKGLAIDNKVSEVKEGQMIIRFFEELGIAPEMNVDSEEFIFDKFAMWYNEKSDINRLREELAKHFDYIDRGSNMAEIVPLGFSKATGIEFLQRYFDVSLENCYAIGDSNNDLSMLKYVPHSIAMGNSSRELYDVVEYVTKDIEEDGIECALKHYNII